MTMAYNVMADNKTVEEKICTFLEDQAEGTAALLIAKGIGLKTTKDVNGVLYSLGKTGKLFKSQDQPPLWSLQKPSAATVCDQESEAVGALTGKLKRLLISDRKGKGMTSSQVATELSLPRKEVNKCLYELRSRGEVEKSQETSLWKIDGKSEEQLITYNSEDRDLSIRLPVHSRFSQDFELLSVLGVGGFGCATKAKHKVDGMSYAVKILEYTGKADREVKALAKLNHPNIVRYYTSWQEDAVWISDFDDDSTTTSYNSDESNQTASYRSGNEAEKCERKLSCLFIKMEFCESGTLKKWIEDRNEGKTVACEDEALHIFNQIVCGVEYIHSKHLIHRDLKPENVFIGRNNTIKIGDFGHVTTFSPSGGRTLDKGTPLYMSPEQVTETTYDTKADIFSLGLICFELLWKMSTISEKCKVFENLRDQVFPKDFDKKYVTEHKLIKRILSKTPAHRPDAKEIAEYMKHFLLRNSTVLQQKSV